MAKVSFLNQTESIKSESYISQLHENQKMKVLYLDGNEKFRKRTEQD